MVAVNTRKIMKTFLNPSSPKGGLQQPPKQISSWCSKSHSQGVKLLRVPSSSSFAFILAKKSKPTTYTGGRVSFHIWDVGGGGGGGTILWFLNWIILKIFEVICTSNFVCKLEWPFSNIFSKNSHENRMFLQIFTKKKSIFAYILHTKWPFLNFRGLAHIMMS